MLFMELIFSQFAVLKAERKREAINPTVHCEIIRFIV